MSCLGLVGKVKSSTIEFCYYGHTYFLLSRAVIAAFVIRSYEEKKVSTHSIEKNDAEILLRKASIKSLLTFTHFP